MLTVTLRNVGNFLNPHWTHTPALSSPVGKHNNVRHLLSVPTAHQFTSSPTVTTPCSWTTLGCLNWPLMAASCRNFTLSASDVPPFSILIATSSCPISDCHLPLFTTPNWPDPRLSPLLPFSTDGKKIE